jgi:hypothetical protein
LDNTQQHIATFDGLFRYNYRPLCLYAMHYLQDADLSEDIVQESYAALWEKLQEGADVFNRNQISKALKVLKEGVHKLYVFFFA